MSKNSSNSRTANSVRNLLAGFGGQLFSIILRFVTRTFFIKILGQEYLGINGLFSDILTMLSLTELGLDSAIVFRMYKPLAEKDDKRVRILLKFYKRAYLVIGAVIVIIGLGLIPFLPHLIKDYDKLADLNINAVVVFLLYLSQSVNTYLFFAYRSSVVIADQKKHLLDIATFFNNLAVNAVQIIILVVWKDFIQYTIAGVVGAVLRNLVNAVIAKKRYPQFFIPEPDNLDKTEIKDMFKDCGSLLITKANAVVLKATDNIVLSKLFGLSVVGLYSNYLLLYTVTNTFLLQIFSAISASVGNLFATEDSKKSYGMFRVIIYLSFILYGTVAACIALCADELILNWISVDYVVPQPLAILVGVEIILAGMTGVLEQIRNTSGVFQKFWFRPLIGIVVNIVVSVVLASICGLYGVILGTIIANLSTTMAIDPYIVHKYTFNSIRPVWDYYKQNLLYLTVLVVVCAADFFFCKYVFIGHGWISLILHVFVTAVSVPAAFILLFIKTEECRYFRKTVSRIINSKLRKRSA